ncbi:unnamed protein product [Toxocara canis]|uniref:Uncharacterized protein n=1 Tax=Toxocara canis TaxID=6265 RepID=A0A183UN90_TOXCA|nr:unnamed protein product [Toxocara canis]
MFYNITIDVQNERSVMTYASLRQLKCATCRAVDDFPYTHPFYPLQKIRYHGQRFSPCQFLTVEASTYGEPPLLTPTGIPAQQLDRDSLDGYVGTIAK